MLILKQSFKSSSNFSILVYTERKTEDNKLVRCVRFLFCFVKIMNQIAPLFLYLLTMR